MKNIFRIFACMLIVFSSSSCITYMILSSQKKQTNSIDRKSVNLSGKTIQRISRHSALMVTDLNDVVCIIYDFDDYYDGMRIKGGFRRSGTYEYLFSDGTIHYAPIFIREKDYRKYKIIAEELEASTASSGSQMKTEPGIGI